MKGNILMIGLVVVFFLVVLVGLYIQVTNKADDFEEAIGSHQSKVMNAYKDGEKALFFIEISGRNSFYESFENLDTDCGTYEGVPLLNSESKSCMNELFEKTVDGTNKKTEKFTEPMPKIDYEIKIGDKGIFFFAKNSLRMDIGGKYNFEISKAPEFKKTEHEEPEPSVPIDEPTYSPVQPTPTTPVQGGSGGKCGFIADYAKQYVAAQCPYSLNLIYGATPQTCHEKPLTCATFVASLYYYTFGEWIYGNGNTKCTDSKVIPMGNNPNSLVFRTTGEKTSLQPGDIFQADLISSRTGQPTAWGHTGIYVGRGYLDLGSYDGPYCFRSYKPDEKGNLIFAHSYGWQDYGQPGVCFSDYKNLFGGGQIIPTNFCRYRGCA